MQKNTNLNFRLFSEVYNCCFILIEIWKSIISRPRQNPWNCLLAFTWYPASNVTRNTVTWIACRRYDTELPDEIHFKNADRDSSFVIVTRLRVG